MADNRVAEAQPPTNGLRPPVSEPEALLRWLDQHERELWWWKSVMSQAIEEFDKALAPFYIEEGGLTVIAGYKCPVQGTTRWHRVLRVLNANPADLVDDFRRLQIERPWEGTDDRPQC